MQAVCTMQNHKKCYQAKRQTALKDRGNPSWHQGWPIFFSPTLERNLEIFYTFILCYIFNMIVSKKSTYLIILKSVERLPGKSLTVKHRLHREDSGQMWSFIRGLNNFTAWQPSTYSAFDGSLDVSAPVRCQSAWVWGRKNNDIWRIIDYCS